MEIDIERMLVAKYPQMSRLVPSAAVRWLARTLHERELNDIIDTYRDATPQTFLDGVMERFEAHTRLHNLSALPVSGRCLFVANHPFGGLDGIALAAELGRRYGAVRVVVNDVLMHVPQLRPIWLPVNKFGQQTRAYADLLERQLRGDAAVLTFPAGVCSRWVHGRVQDVRWHTSYLRQAALFERPVVPVYIDGTLSPRFYRLYRLRRALGIRAGVEMLWLVDEMFRQTGRQVDMVFGRPLTPAELAAHGSVFEQNRYVRQCTYELSKIFNYAEPACSALGQSLAAK